MFVLLTALVVAAPGEMHAARDKLRLGLDYRAWGRDLQFSDGAGATGQSVGPLPTGVTLDVQWFPAAYFVEDRGADVGVALRVDMAPDFKVPVGGASFGASVMRLRTGLLFRLPLRYAEPSIHAGLHVFEATTSARASDGRPRPNTPNVSYQGPRVGLGLRLLEVLRITFDVSGGVTPLLGLGELRRAAFFPDAKGTAFDVQVGLALRTVSWLDVRLGVDVTVHALELGNGQTATDAMYGMTLGLVFKGVP